MSGLDAGQHPGHLHGHGHRHGHGPQEPAAGDGRLQPDRQPSGSTATLAPDPCTLAPDATTSADDSTCTVTFTANSVGNYTLQGAYQPAPTSVHATSTGSDTIEVRARTTSTTVECTPDTFQAGESTTCKATDTDTDDAPRSAPTGTVTWTSSESAGVFVTSPCVLAPDLSTLAETRAAR